MALHLQINEVTATRRRIPFHAFTSDGTSPDTGLSGDSIRISHAGGAEWTLDALVSAVSANAGTYYVEAPSGSIATVGPYHLWYDQGDFAQDVAFVQGVAYDPFGSETLGSVGKILQGGSTTEVRLASTETASNDVFNGAQFFLQYPSGQVVGNVISDYTGSNQSAKLKSTLPVAAASGMSYFIIAGTPLNDIDGTDVTVTAFANDSLTSDAVDDDALGPEHFADGAIAAAAIGADAITNAKIADAAFAAEQFATDSITSAKIADNAIGPEHLADGALTAAAIGADAITSAKVADAAISVEHISVSAYSEIAKSVMTASLAGSGVPHATRNLANALRPLRNKFDGSSSVLTVFAENDTTSGWTGSITTSATQGPISSIDPK